FIPSTPTPFTGFTITVPAADAVDLPITIDEAIRFIITGGALVPAKDSAAAAAAATRAHAALRSAPGASADPVLAGGGASAAGADGDAPAAGAAASDAPATDREPGA